MERYICALDIGSSKLAASLAVTNKKHISRLFFESAPVKGIKHGMVTDAMEAVSSISRLMKALKAKSGINIRFVYANISGQNIVTRHSHAIIPLAERGNKVVTSFDIEKVNEQARILSSSLEEEIIHQMPFSYNIDSQDNILNPIGLYSHRLGVDLYLVSSRLSSLQSFIRMICQAGYEARDLFFSGIATGAAVFDQRSEAFTKGLNVFCDIGSDITELLVYRGGMLKDIEIISAGGNDLTAQISEALNIPFDLAEDVKNSYASVGDPGRIKEDKEILLKKNNLYQPIKQRLVVELVTSKAKSFCSDIKDAVARLAGREKIDNFTACGRTVLLDGFLEALEEGLGIPVALARINNPAIASLVNNDSALSGQQKYLTYITSLGIICQVIQGERSPAVSYRPALRNPIFKAIRKAVEVYQEYF